MLTNPGEIMFKPSHYEVLGIQDTADEKEIQKAYAKLALIWHSDSAKNWAGDRFQDSVEIFRRLTTAKETLCDAKAREKYDRELNVSKKFPPGVDAVKSSEAFTKKRNELTHLHNEFIKRLNDPKYDNEILRRELANERAKFSALENEFAEYKIQAAARSKLLEEECARLTKEGRSNREAFNFEQSNQSADHQNNQASSKSASTPQQNTSSAKEDDAWLNTEAEKIAIQTIFAFNELKSNTYRYNVKVAEWTGNLPLAPSLGCRVVKKLLEAEQFLQELMLKDPSRSGEGFVFTTYRIVKTGKLPLLFASKDEIKTILLDPKTTKFQICFDLNQGYFDKYLAPFKNYTLARGQTMADLLKQIAEKLPKENQNSGTYYSSRRF